MNAFERLKEARHAGRPTGAAYVAALFENRLDLCGDRRFGEDSAIISGIGTLSGRPVTYIAIDKGADLDSRMRNHFVPHAGGLSQGSAPDEAGRKIPPPRHLPRRHARRLLRRGGRGARAGRGHRREHSGNDGPAHAGHLRRHRRGAAAAARWRWLRPTACICWKTPFTPSFRREGCASILWKDSGRVADAAQCLHITAADMVDLHVAEEIIPENFADFPQMCAAMTVQLTMDLDELVRPFAGRELPRAALPPLPPHRVYEENGVSSASRNIEIFRTISEYHKYHVIFES